MTVEHKKEPDIIRWYFNLYQRSTSALYS